jgi:hypothetical protein
VSENTTCSPDNPCTAVQLINAAAISDRATNKEWRDKTDRMLEKLQNRLPLWTTLLISILTATCGFLAKAVTV